MYDNQETHLEMRWLPVTDEDGRTHMEACWITVGEAHAPVSHEDGHGLGHHGHDEPAAAQHACPLAGLSEAGSLLA